MWSPFWEQGSDWHGPGADQEGAGSLILQSPGELRAPGGFQAQLAYSAGRGARHHGGAPQPPTKGAASDADSRDRGPGRNEGMRVLTNGIKMHYAAAETNLMDSSALARRDHSTRPGPRCFGPTRKVSFPKAGWHPSPARWCCESTPSRREPPFEEPPDAEHQGEPAERPTEHRGETSRTTRRTPRRNQQNDPQNTQENHRNDPRRTSRTTRRSR